MRLISWNVNGIRAVLKKGFMDFVKTQDFDFLCLQEIKAQPEQVDLDIKDYNLIWNSAEKKGYSGTLILAKKEPLKITKGLGIEDYAGEGRVITLEYDNFFLVNVYTPNSKRGLERLEYRKNWDADFLSYVKELEKSKPVIFCGDLNVAHKEIDLKNHKSNMTTKTKPGNAGFTDTERKGFKNIVNSGFIDTFRYFYPDKENMYTWWSYMFNARAKNVGWRIDYFCVSNVLKDKLKKAEILSEVLGSDHCPISLKIDI
jgi:exodeoxyribonuclease III